MQGISFWSERPSSTQALTTAAWVAALAGILALLATRVSPFSTRSHLELGADGLEDVYLTEMPEDPGRALLTTKRENSTWTRDQASQAGDPYWVRRFGDPARPGLQERVLLTSRSRGAHLLVPLGALDLERVLAEVIDDANAPAGTSPTTSPDSLTAEPLLRHSLAHVYWNRAFAGVFLHLRFPKRELAAEGPEAGKAFDFDLVIARGNRLCTTDFLLQPNGQLYRDALADGLFPRGALRRNPSTEDEVVLLMRAEPDRPGVALYSPLSLFDELGLCWGAELPIVVDDRWRIDEAPAFALRPPSAAVRAQVAWNGALHLSARFESADERAALAQALARFAGS